MRILFAGTPAAAVPSLETLAARGNVVGVLTRPDNRAGRGGRAPTASPVAAAAAARGLPIIRATRMDQSATEHVASLQPDIVAIVAYGALIPPPLLPLPAHGWVNLHFSLLPAWRGAAPVQHAIWNGDSATGASTFQLEAGLDTGPVFDTLTETIEADTTATELLNRLALRGADLLACTLEAIAAGTAQPRPQTGTVTLAPKITTAHAHVDFHQSAEMIERHIRAMTEHPGAWATFRGERIKLGPVRLCPSGKALPPGLLESRSEGVFVGTGSSAVELRTVQPAGKRPMTASAWARGALNTSPHAQQVLNG